ncbi:hypothetical protein ACPGAX_004513 [Enterobacter quasiroggenkampii]
MCQVSAYRSGSSPLFCYELAGDVIFFPDKNLLMNTMGTNFCRVQLRTTMGNLLLFLLENARGQFLTDEEIMMEVWEKNGLRASSQRLLQVTRSLNYKLQEAGLTVRLFHRGKKGFFIDTNLIVPFYKEVVVSHTSRYLKEHHCE